MKAYTVAIPGGSLLVREWGSPGDPAAAEVPVLLLVAPRPGVELDSDPITRFRSALPAARIEPLAGGIHDLVSHAPAEVAELVGEFATEYR